MADDGEKLNIKENIVESNTISKDHMELVAKIIDDPKSKDFKNLENGVQTLGFIDSQEKINKFFKNINTFVLTNGAINSENIKTIEDAQQCKKVLTWLKEKDETIQNIAFDKNDTRITKINKKREEQNNKEKAKEDERVTDKTKVGKWIEKGTDAIDNAGEAAIDATKKGFSYIGAGVDAVFHPKNTITNMAYKEENDYKTIEDALDNYIKEEKEKQAKENPTQKEQINTYLDEYGKTRNTTKQSKEQIKEQSKDFIKAFTEMFGGTDFLNNDFFKGLAKFFGVEEDAYNSFVRNTLTETFDIKDAKKEKLILDTYNNKEFSKEKILLKDQYGNPTADPSKIIEHIKTGSTDKLNGTDKDGKEINVETDKFKGTLAEYITQENIHNLDAATFLAYINNYPNDTTKEIDINKLFKTDGKKVEWQEGELDVTALKTFVETTMLSKDSPLWDTILKANAKIQTSGFIDDYNKMRDGIYSEADVARYIMTIFVSGDTALAEKVSFTDLTIQGVDEAWKMEKIKTVQGPKPIEPVDKIEQKIYTINDKSNADIRDATGASIKNEGITETEVKIQTTNGNLTIKKGSEIGITDNTDNYVETKVTIDGTITTVYIKRDNITEKPANA